MRHICKLFPGHYWQQLDEEKKYPVEFVHALTESGYLAVMIPEEYGGSQWLRIPMLAPYNAYRANDLYIMIAAGNNNLFQRLCNVLAHPEWVKDPRFLDNSDRVFNRVTLNNLIGDVVIKETSDKWLLLLDAARVPCAPSNTVGEVCRYPQTKAIAMLKESPDGKMCQVGLSLSFDAKRPVISEEIPVLGSGGLELTAPVLKDI